MIISYKRAAISQKAKLNAAIFQETIRGNPTGVLVAVRTERGDICFGSSFCDRRHDHFSKKIGVAIAKGRAMKYGERPMIYEGAIIPIVMKDVATPDFVKRCELFFREEGLAIHLESCCPPHGYEVIKSVPSNTVRPNDWA